LIVSAIREAGYEPGKQIAIALDPRWQTSFCEDGRYVVPSLGEGRKSSGDLVALFADWVSRYPIVSI